MNKFIGYLKEQIHWTALSVLGYIVVRSMLQLCGFQIESSYAPAMILTHLGSIIIGGALIRRIFGDLPEEQKWSL